MILPGVNPRVRLQPQSLHPHEYSDAAGLARVRPAGGTGEDHSRFLNALNVRRPFRAFTDAFTQWNLWEEWDGFVGRWSNTRDSFFWVGKLPVPYDTLEERYKVSWVTGTIG